MAVRPGQEAAALAKRGLSPLLAALVVGCAGAPELAEVSVEPLPAVYSPVERLGDCRGRHSSYTQEGRRYWVENVPVGHTEFGAASWYGRQFHGKKTASGEVFDMYKMSAAHKTLPLFSTVTVVNLANGREISVKINDRGPFIGGRLIDLSYAAAKKLGMVEAGVAPVQITVAETPSEGKSRTALAE